MTFRNLFPTYCPNCQKLMFIGKHQNQALYAVDYEKANWIQHDCTDDMSHIYQNDLILEYINENDLSSPIPFLWRKGKKDQSSKILRPGIVLSVEERGESRMLDVITVDNKQISLKIIKDATIIQPGNIVELKQATRIGQNRFRLTTVKLLEVPSDSFENGTVLSEFYIVNITGHDQEKLELFMDKAIRHFKQQQISVFGIVPLPIVTQDAKKIFTRQIFIRPVSELVKKIQRMHLTEGFDLFIEQIKNKQINQ